MTAVDMKTVANGISRCPFPQGIEYSQGKPPLLIMASVNCTRVSAPESHGAASGPPWTSRGAASRGPPRLSPELMTPTAQIPSMEGEGCMTTLPPVLSRQKPPSPDLRQSIRLAAWNVLTLSEDSFQVAMQNTLAKHDIDIACLSECRIPDNGISKIDRHTLIHSGGKTRIYGVAILISPAMFSALVSWRAVSDRLLHARFMHRHGYLTVISVYAPTEISPMESKEKFYDDLSALISHTPPHDKLIVAGDFNAVSGSERLDLETIIGPFGSGNRNDNSHRLISLCASNNLSIMGSWFRRRNIHRWTWISPDKRTKKEIDHFLLRDRRDATQLRVLRGIEAPANSDHKLVILHFKISFPYSKSRNKSPRIDSRKLLNDLTTRNAFQLELTNRFSALAALEEETNPDKVSELITDSILGAAKVTAVHTFRPNKPWLSQSSLDIIAQKRNAMLSGDTDRRKQLHKQFKERSLRDKESYLDSIASQAEEANRRHDMNGIFKAVRLIAGTRKQNSLPNINKSDGSPCRTMQEALATWQEHFKSALNHPPSLNPWASPRPPEHTQYLPPPDESSIKRAISKLKLGRSSGNDKVTAEMLRASADIIAPALCKLFRLVWVSGRVPQIWKDATIVPVYKGKGCKQTCSNYRPISLLSVIGKLFASILLDYSQQTFLDFRLPEQSGFTPGRSTCDAILTLRILSDIHRLYRRPLYVAYIDFKAAFDSVDRSALWAALSSLDLPDPLHELICELHNGTSAKVLVNNTLSPSFESLSGVRQGCVLAPSLFCLVMDVVLHSTQPSTIDLNGHLFSDSAYADDAAFIDSSTESLTGSLHRLQTEGAKFGLNISWSKTKIQNISSGAPPDPVVVDGNLVETVTDFKYLGSIIESGSGSHKEILRRITLAGSVLNSLSSIWKEKRLSLQLKLRLFNSLVVPVLLYGSETWIVLQADADRINGFYMQAQRRILDIRWYQLVSNATITSMTALPPIIDVIRKRRLTLFGHVARLPPGVPAHEALCAGIDVVSNSAVPNGWRRPRGRPCKTWLDQIISDIYPESDRKPWCDILTCAMDRDLWREEVAMACARRYD